MCEKIDLVVARYNESVDWLNEIDASKYNILLYNKGVDNVELQTAKLENYGREAQTYLHYITTNYNTIPNGVIFLQGDPFPHCYSIEMLSNTPIYGEKIKIVESVHANRYIPSHKNLINFLNTYSFTDEIQEFGAMHQDFGYIEERELLKDLLSIGERKIIADAAFVQGAQFYIPKKFITNKPLTFWEKLLSYNTPNNNIICSNTIGYVLERTWLEIFKYEPL